MIRVSTRGNGDMLKSQMATLLLKNTKFSSQTLEGVRAKKGAKSHQCLPKCRHMCYPFQHAKAQMLKSQILPMRPKIK